MIILCNKDQLLVWSLDCVIGCCSKDTENNLNVTVVIATTLVHNLWSYRLLASLPSSTPASWLHILQNRESLKDLIMCPQCRVHGFVWGLCNQKLGRSLVLDFHQSFTDYIEIFLVHCWVWQSWPTLHLTFVCCSTLAPACSSSSATWAWPPKQAAWSAANPLWKSQQ